MRGIYCILLENSKLDDALSFAQKNSNLIMPTLLLKKLELDNTPLSSSSLSFSPSSRFGNQPSNPYLMNVSSRN